MLCCPVPAVKQCRGYLPTCPSSPCYSPVVPPLPTARQCPVYGGYLRSPCESLRPLCRCQGAGQGVFRQLIYYQTSGVRWWEWARLYLMWLSLYLLLPLALVLANLAIVRHGPGQLSLLVIALLYNAYHDIIFAHCHALYTEYRRTLTSRSQAEYTLAQIVEFYRPFYNHVTFQIR